ncbi:hypothetical protein C4D60_Mb02t03750 [Musa balbisiana]|uniref:Uncharacterized protein n=1 Tax=Musa balbisiana TaxID=52838 RepID=A0A4S8I813_MUSBA|nr:hypothetical protein C4D60_Mb02t03750 [Musa balbisiana]
MHNEHIFSKRERESHSCTSQIPYSADSSFNCSYQPGGKLGEVFAFLFFYEILMQRPAGKNLHAKLMFMSKHQNHRYRRLSFSPPNLVNHQGQLSLLLAWSSWWSKLVQDQVFDLIWERLPSYHLK